MRSSWLYLAILSVREAEKLAQRMLKPADERKKAPDRDVMRLQEELAEKLGARVTLAPRKGGKGRLVINYDSLEQLDGIIAKF